MNRQNADPEDKGDTFEDRLDEVFKMEVEDAQNEKDVKSIIKTLHKFAEKHPIKSKPWWPCNWMDNYGIILLHLKKYPRSWDFMNAVENYDRISTREIEEIVKETNKKHSVIVVDPNIRYLAFVADAEFYAKMSVMIGRAESVVRKYLAALCELGALKRIGATGQYHNLPVYSFGYYSGAVLNDKIPLYARFFTQDYVKKQKELTP
jgi:hypothetical protein